MFLKNIILLSKYERDAFLKSDGIEISKVFLWMGKIIKKFVLVIKRL